MAEQPPVRDFLQDEDGDLSAAGGYFGRVAGADAVPQGIRIHLRTFRGEIYTDESQGVPWLQQIIGKGNDPLVVKELIRESIADVPDVTNVASGELTLDSTRNASVNYAADTIYSENPIVGSADLGLVI